MKVNYYLMKFNHGTLTDSLRTRIKISGEQALKLLDKGDYEFYYYDSRINCINLKHKDFWNAEYQYLLIEIKRAKDFIDI